MSTSAAVRSYFNPRSREGSDSTTTAPARGTIFQSTLPRRERRQATDCHRPWPEYFNPRSREGSDAKTTSCRSSTFISIHAPAKGATKQEKLTDLLRHFNPRSREGSDRIISHSLFTISYFNPRSREGSDTLRRLPGYVGGHFNPRSREGSDRDERRLADYACISIHAPAKGATTKHEIERKLHNISIHAPAKGATHSRHTAGLMPVFQSTLPRRERRSADSR